MRDFERRQHANGACELWAPCADRQQQKLEVDRFTGLVLRRHRRNRADAFVSKDRKQVGHGGPACRGPEAEEGFPFEFSAEQRADPRASEANRMTGTAIERKNEGVAERAANGAGLDVGALGRRACPALLLPISIKLPARGVLHEELLPYSRPPFTLSPIGTGITAFGRPGSSEQGLCRARLWRWRVGGNAQLILTKR